MWASASASSFSLILKFPGTHLYSALTDFVNIYWRQIFLCLKPSLRPDYLEAQISSHHFVSLTKLLEGQLLRQIFQHCILLQFMKSHVLFERFFLHFEECISKMSVQGPLTIHREMHRYLLMLFYSKIHGTSELYLPLIQVLACTLEQVLAKRHHREIADVKPVVL